MPGRHGRARRVTPAPCQAGWLWAHQSLWTLWTLWTPGTPGTPGRHSPARGVGGGCDRRRPLSPGSERRPGVACRPVAPPVRGGSDPRSRERRRLPGAESSAGARADAGSRRNGVWWNFRTVGWRRAGGRSVGGPTSTPWRGFRARRPSTGWGREWASPTRGPGGPGAATCFCALARQPDQLRSERSPAPSARATADGWRSPGGPPPWPRPRSSSRRAGPVAGAGRRRRCSPGAMPVPSGHPLSDGHPTGGGALEPPPPDDAPCVKAG